MFMWHVLSTGLTSHLAVFLRSSCMYGTCCLWGKTYSIGFLRFCKQVGPGHPQGLSRVTCAPVSPLPLPCLRMTALGSTSCLSGHPAVLRSEAPDGHGDGHPAGLWEISRRRLQVCRPKPSFPQQESDGSVSPSCQSHNDEGLVANLLSCTHKVR